MVTLGVAGFVFVKVLALGEVSRVVNQITLGNVSAVLNWRALAFILCDLLLVVGISVFRLGFL